MAKPHRVGEYIIANGDNRQFVIYWYQAHGRSVANEYLAKIYMVDRRDADESYRWRAGQGDYADRSHRRYIGSKGPGRGIYRAACAMLPRFIPN